MGTSEPTEAEAFADWCARLPGLREEAAAAGVADRLDRDVARVREGGSARAAQRKWSAPGGGAWRSWSEPAGAAMAGLPGRALLTSVGDYRCPAGRCPRRATRDEHGHPPTCALFDRPMNPAR